MKYSKEFYSNYSKHFHDKLNINFIEEGEIQIEFKDNRFEQLKADEISLFRAFEIHQTKDLSKDSKGYYVLYFDTLWLEQFPKIHLNTNVIKDKKLYARILDISKRLLNDEKNLEEELRSFFKDLSIYFIEIDENDEMNILINDIKNYLIENIELSPTLENLSENFALSKEHIIRIFKKEFGLTPHAFILSHKINQAKNSIFDAQSKNISYIASENGFYDQSHFSKSFKKVFAINPNEVLK